MRIGQAATTAGDKALTSDNAIVLVLAVLRGGARHGYDIAREVERASDNALTFKHATLYLVLHEMENAGLIASRWQHPRGERPRRVYSLTAYGLAECELRLKTWSQFTQAMGKVIAASADSPTGPAGDMGAVSET